MTQGDGIIDRLAVLIEADRTGLNAGLGAAVRDSKQAGVQAGQGLKAGLSAGLSGIGAEGQKAGAQFGDGLNAKLHDGRGQLGRTGQQLGDAVTDGMAQGIRQGGQGVNSALNGLSAQLAGGGGGLNAAFGRLTLGAGGLSGGLTAIIGTAGPAGAAIAGVGAAAAAVVAPVNAAINEFAKFEVGLAKVSTLTDKTPDQLASTGRAVLNMSTELGMSFQDLQAGLYDVLGAGVRGTEDMGAALKFVNEAAKLAVAGATETAVATDGLTSVMNAYKLSASDTKMVSDSLFQAVKDGKISFNELAGGVGMVTAIAADANVPLQTVLAALATMTANGVQASSSIDYLRSLISAIINPTEKAASTAKSLGIEFNAQALNSKGLVGVLQDVMRATKGNKDQMGDLLGGVEAITAATSIASGNFDRMKTNLDNQAKSAGATETAYAKMAGTLQKENDKVSANWSKLMVNLGQAFAPFKTEVLQGINSMLDGLNKFIERMNLARGARNAGNDVIKWQGELDGARSGKRAVLDEMAAYKGRGEAIPQFLSEALRTADATIKELEAKIRAAQAEQASARAQQTAYNVENATSNLPGNAQGPRLGGDENTGAYNSPSNSTEYASNVAMQAIRKTGMKTADEVVDHCSQWVRLTLGKADERVKPFINKLFQLDADKDGTVEARDVQTNAQNAGLFRKYNNQRDLRPGDTVFYEDGGAGHVGIYIGGGMVRGNNRVTYEATGGKTPVGNVPIDKLGRVSGYVSASDLGRAAGVTEGRPAPQPTGAPTPTPDPTAGPLTAEQIRKAQQLTAAIEKAQDALKLKPGDVGLTKALDAATQKAKQFSEASEGNARALAAVRSGQQGVTKAAGEYIATQADLKKYGNEALRLIKDQEAAQKSGNSGRIAAAQQAISLWQGESKARASVLDLERAAYQSRQQAANKKPELTDLQRDQAIQREREAMEALEKAIRKASRARLDSIVAGGVTEKTSLAQWEAARKEIERREALAKNPQLSQLEKDQRAQREMQAQAALEKSIRASSRDRLNDLVVGGVTPEVSLDKWKAADAEIKRRDAAAKQDREKKAQEEKQLAQELSSLQIDKATATAQRLKALDDATLKNAGDNLTKRAELVKRLSQEEYDRQVKLAAAIRDKALQDAKGKPNEGALRDLAFENYRGAETTARNTRADAVTAANKATQDSVRSLRNEYAQLAEGMREKIKAGKVEADDVTAYLATLDALRVKTDAAGLSNNKFLTGAQRSANSVLDDALLTSDALKNLPDGFNRATLAGKSFTVSLEDALAQLPVGTQATETYVKALEELAAEGKVAKDTVEAIKQAIADRAVIWQMEADEIQRVTDEAVRNADTLAELGDTEGAIDALSATLSGLYDRLGQGEDVADAIGLVIDRINELGAALSLDTEFNGFVASLGGSLSDQIKQVVEKLAGTTDTKLKGRLQTLLTDLRGQIAQAYSTTYEIPDGRQPAKPSDGPGYDAIARARDLQTALAGPTDPDAVGPTPAELQALIGDAATLLSSEVGKKLPEATRTALEEAVKGAEGYIATLSDITADAVTDGWERGRKDAPAPPQNRYAETVATLTLMGGGLADDAKREGVTEGLNRMRQAGELTGEQLKRLLKLIEQLGGDTLRFEGVKEEMEALTSSLRVGTISLEDFAGQAGPLSVRMERLADAAERNKDPKLAAQYRDLAVQLRNLIPVLGSAADEMDRLSKLNKWLDYASQIASGFEQIGGAVGGNLGANIAGFGKALNTTVGIVKDIATGNYIGAAIKFLVTLADAIGGFQKANRQALEQQKQFNEQFSFINGNDYAKTFVKSRGFFADMFGGGPEVKQEIDKIGLMYAKTAEDSWKTGLKNGMSAALDQNDFSAFSKTLRQSVFAGMKDGMLDLFLNDVLLKEIIAPAIKAWSDALKTPGTEDDEAAMAGIDAALARADQVGERFYNDVNPRLDKYADKWGIDQGSNSSSSMFGAVPEMQLGVPRIEVTLPDTLMRPLGEFATAVPVFARAADKWERIADRIAASLRSGGGLQGPSGLGGLT